jgi:hypothetical protein
MMEQPPSELAQVKARPSIENLPKHPKECLLLAYLAVAALVPLVCASIFFTKALAPWIWILGLAWIVGTPFALEEFRERKMKVATYVASYPGLSLTAVITAAASSVVPVIGAIVAVAVGAAIFLVGALLPFAALREMVPLARIACQPPRTVLGCGKQHRTIEAGE